MRTDIHFLVGDCLRAADTDRETMPFAHQWADTNATRCYAPSTWTVPSHASLYAVDEPLGHDVSRLGDRISTSQAQLPATARQAGYTTALFSENPSFGPVNGFDAGIDYCDSDINFKQFRSPFSPTMVADSLTPEAVPKIAGAVLRQPRRLRNLLNLLYGTYEVVSDQDPHDYPHHGKRVQEHLASYIDRSQRPLLTFTNFLDPHNPHHSPPPERAAEALGLSVSKAETNALAAVDSPDVVFTDANPPEAVRAEFRTWEQVYQRQREIYRAQIRETDYLVADLVADCPEALADALVIVTGDHGHLFYDDGLVGHHSWLHPKLIQVPLFISFPASWQPVASEIDTPVSLVDVARAVERTASGEIRSAAGFVAELTSQEEVLVVADGPTWDVDPLYEEYPDDAVDSVAAKRVGRIVDDQLTIYERTWGEETIRKRVFEITDAERELLAESVEKPGDERIAAWLTAESSTTEMAPTQRLKDLGYVE